LFGNNFQHIFLDDKNISNWRAKAKKLKEFAQKLNEVADECLKDKEVLWVLGL
jgi:hypothetical protein